MKLGVSYNVFDGEELLEASINSFKDCVDYVSVVYQEVSNIGIPCNPSLKTTLEDLLNRNLIDEVVCYYPSIQLGSHTNEKTKRQIGLELSIRNGCTHHMSCDTDELYLKDQFETAKKLIEVEDYDSSFCQMQTYYKSKDYVLDPAEEYYVPFIYKIHPNSRFGMSAAPVLVDCTRTLTCGKAKIFARNELEMHHFSHVRNNYRLKLDNSSARVNFNNSITNLVEYFNAWEYPMPAKVPSGGGMTTYKIKKVNTW